MAATILDDWVEFTNGDNFTPSAGSNRLVVVAGLVESNTAPLPAIDGATWGDQDGTLQVDAVNGTSSPRINVAIVTFTEAQIAARTGNALDLTASNPGNVATFAPNYVATYQDVQQTNIVVDTGEDAGSGQHGDVTVDTVDDGFLIAISGLGNGTDNGPYSWSWDSPMIEETEENEVSTSSSVAAVASDGDSETVGNTISGGALNRSAIAAMSIRPVQEIDADVDSFLPTVAATVDVIVDVDSAVDSFLPTVAATLDVEIDINSAVSSFLPTVAAALDVQIDINSAISAGLPTVDAAIASSITLTSAVSSFLPTVDAAVTVPADINAAVASFLPTVTAAVTVPANVDVDAVGFLPTVDASIRSLTDINGAVSSFLPLVSAAITVPADINAAVNGLLPLVNAVIDSGEAEREIENGPGIRQDDMKVDMMRAIVAQQAIDDEEMVEIMPALAAVIAQI